MAAKQAEKVEQSLLTCCSTRKGLSPRHGSQKRRDVSLKRCSPCLRQAGRPKKASQALALLSENERQFSLALMGG